MKKVLLLVAVILVASVALTGCGKKTSTTNTGASDTPPAPPTSDTIPTDATK